MPTVTINNKDVDFDAAIMLMEDEIRERIHNDLAPCSEQEFIDAYVEAHKVKYNEQFIVA